MMRLWGDLVVIPPQGSKRESGRHSEDNEQRRRVRIGGYQFSMSREKENRIEGNVGKRREALGIVDDRRAGTMKYE